MSTCISSSSPLRMTLRCRKHWMRIRPCWWSHTRRPWRSWYCWRATWWSGSSWCYTCGSGLPLTTVRTGVWDTITAASISVCRHSVSLCPTTPSLQVSITENDSLSLHSLTPGDSLCTMTHVEAFSDCFKCNNHIQIFWIARDVLVYG